MTVQYICMYIPLDLLQLDCVHMHAAVQLTSLADSVQWVAMNVHTHPFPKIVVTCTDIEILVESSGVQTTCRRVIIVIGLYLQT